MGATESLHSVDVLLRVGHLITRWGLLHELNIRIGIDHGELASCTMDGGKKIHFGRAIAGARVLALNVLKPHVVHLSAKAKGCLHSFRSAILMISSTPDAFILT